MELAEALAAAHRAGVVHRDLKPSNIMLTKSGVKVLDFGLAKLLRPPENTAVSADWSADTMAPLTGSGVFVGTLPYMAPEQLEGRVVDSRVDLFSFGAIIYEMVTGRRAFSGDSQVSLMAAILDRDPDPVSVYQPLASPGLDRLVRKCLAKDPDARWQSASDLADELRWLAAGSGSGAAPAAPRTVRRTRPPVLVFIKAANTPRLHAAFDQLVGQGCWLRPAAIGTFPVRFRSAVDPGDAGWHIDVSFGAHTPEFLSWRANIHSKGRALMLFLFSDVGEPDAPTRIGSRSHADIARQLAPAGEQRLTLRELAADGFATSAHRPVVTATGDAGTVYLCHPFLVHAAQPHQGKRPRFLPQPPLLPVDPDNRPHGDLNPVEQATARALGHVL